MNNTSNTNKYKHIVYAYYEAPDNIMICTCKYDGITFKAKAKCIEGDIYDREKGKNIAKNKVDLKIKQYRIKMLNKEIEENKKNITELRKEVCKYFKKIESYEQKRDRLIIQLLLKDQLES